MKIPFKKSESKERRGLTPEEVRLIGDLGIMHAKVDELYQIVRMLAERHRTEDIREYSDHPVLAENIRKIDEIYLWFVKLKENRGK